MAWFVVLGLISLAFILSGCGLAARRIRRYRQETETRRARAFAEMKEIAEEKNTEHRTHPSTELRARNAERRRNRSTGRLSD